MFEWSLEWDCRGQISLPTGMPGKLKSPLELYCMYRLPEQSKPRTAGHGIALSAFSASADYDAATHHHSRDSDQASGELNETVLHLCQQHTTILGTLIRHLGSSMKQCRTSVSNTPPF